VYSFDTVDKKHLREILKRRVSDGVILKLIGKWLNAGVWEKGETSYPEKGTPQGGVITPPTMLQTLLVGP
jgi:retron-type reverse transcriptase